MKIEHVAIWTRDLEQMRTFYETYFGAKAGRKYRNPVTEFESYFLEFESGSRLELMTRPGIQEWPRDPGLHYQGLVHLALSVGSRERVTELTERLRQDGFSIIGEPRTTGDGYFESVVLDPDGNRIEITI